MLRTEFRLNYQNNNNKFLKWKTEGADNLVLPFLESNPTTENT